MADRTEAPTPRRLEEAREQGQVALSREVTSAAVLLAAALLLRGPGGQLGVAFQKVLTEQIAALPQTELTLRTVQHMGFRMAAQILPPLGGLVLALLAVGAAATLGQTRFLWSSKRVGFDFKRVDPVAGFKRIFSARGLVEMLRALLKLALVGWVTYSFLKSEYPSMLALSQFDLPTATQRFFDLLVALTLRVGGMYLILAAADYAYQRWDLMRNLRMTKEEIKEEVRRSEGDPQLKGRIRSQMRRMARGRMMANVPKATVVVTNPTHLAVAIQYEEGMNAPKVLAKGAHHTAERIVAIAREHHIPVVQNIPLARAMYKRLEVDDEISPDLYVAMAEVLAYVYRMQGKTPAPARASMDGR